MPLNIGLVTSELAGLPVPPENEPPLPLTMLHDPVPTVGVFAASVVELLLQRL